MKSSRSIWRRFILAFRGDRELFALVSDHIGKVSQTVRGLHDLIDSSKSSDWSGVEAWADRIAKDETEADNVHRNAVLKISRGAFFAGLRDDFLDLLESIDNIADAAQNAARIFTESQIPPKVVEYVLKDLKIECVAEKLSLAVAVLTEAIDAISHDANLAVSKSLEVEKIEQEVDEAKNRLIRDLMQHRSDIETLTLLQLKEFILKLDEVADSAEDTSDLVIAIVAKARA